MKPSAAIWKMVAIVVLAGVVPAAIALTAFVAFGTRTYVDPGLHEGAELVGSCIAIAVALLLLLRVQQGAAPRHFLPVAGALVAMGLIDAMHAMHGIEIHSWHRHLSTLAGGVLFAVVWLPLPQALRRPRIFFLALLCPVLAIALPLGFGSGRWPATWDSTGRYTFAVRALNVLGGAGFLAAAAFFLRRYWRKPAGEEIVFACQTTLFGSAALLFGFSHTWSADWWAWHGFRLLAYGVVLIAVNKMLVSESMARQQAEGALRQSEA